MKTYSEAAFENAIVDHLPTHAGYIKGNPGTFDRGHGLDTGVLLSFFALLPLIPTIKHSRLGCGKDIKAFYRVFGHELVVRMNEVMNSWSSRESECYS